MPRKVLFAAVLVALAAAPLTACGGSGASGATVPSLAGSGNTGAQGGGSRAAALHAAAQCIRQHGIPHYADPVLTPSGAVYSDSRSIQDAAQSTIDAVRQACGTLLAEAQLNPESEPPAPPQFVQAGVLAAECFRAHGMPTVRDPNAQTPYVPGHGFSLDASEVPPGGKASPVFQRAIQACHAQDTAEIQASTLASLGNDG
jgi:hypothetical protein